MQCMGKTGIVFSAGWENFPVVSTGYAHRAFVPSTQRSCCWEEKSYDITTQWITHRMEIFFVPYNFVPALSVRRALRFNCFLALLWNRIERLFFYSRAVWNLIGSWNCWKMIFIGLLVIYFTNSYTPRRAVFCRAHIKIPLIDDQKHRADHCY